MKGRMYILNVASGEIEVAGFSEPPTLAVMQGAVEGPIEAVPWFTTIWTLEDGATVSCLAYCNENGKLENLPYNTRATVAWDAALRRMTDPDGDPLYPNGLNDENGQATDVLVGNVIVIVGDEEFMRRHTMGADELQEDGTFVPVDEWWLEGGDFVPACQGVQA
jgi:hypothetical protein